MSPLQMESPRITDMDHHPMCYYASDAESLKRRPLHPLATSPATPAAPGRFRSLGNSTPLGLCSFAATACAAGIINMQLVPSSTVKLIVPLALLYGGFALFFAGIWEFLRNNHFGGTSFCSYGAYWAGRGLFDLMVASSIPPDDVRIAVGTIQLVWTVFTFLMLIVSLRTNLMTFFVFVFMTLSSLFVTIGKLGDVLWVVKVGGFFNICYAVVAWYGALSNLIKEVWQEDLLPIRSLAHPKPSTVEFASNNNYNNSHHLRNESSREVTRSQRGSMQRLEMA